MHASIEGEDDGGCGLTVVDNNDVEHWIEIKYDRSEISYHEQDGYPDDPAKRKDDNDEHVNQARRYAKYYVYQQRGYDTVANADNPAYIDAVREAVAELTNEEFERYFKPLHQQIQSHHDNSIERPVDLPSGVRAPDAVVYELDVYLGVDLAASELENRAEAIAQAHGLDFEEGTATKFGSEVTDSDLQDWEDAGEELVQDADPSDLETTVSAVSGIHVGYPNIRGEHQVKRSHDALTREPDATIELIPSAPDSLEEFQPFLEHHLRCQVRDCFVGMGFHPPEAYRVIGFGKFISARRYDQYGLYPPLHTGPDEDDDDGLLF